ncbi:transposase [Methylomonas sp. SURF-1]|uniref:Transposase n=1 Tax=Methylomonas aurea TaxID=2952224 RepID=A0ABT1UMD8_9GAMM|nr:transposase [Methylomonas sp. SURF-1]MCQ8182854.1 transposase [Methylomonas sp. SURF-1]
MTRPIRIEFSGALYHVTSRGDRRENIYEDDEDRIQFLDVLRRVVEDFNWVCHAYCLMTNHYHLVVETPDANLAKGMRQLNGVFTQASNRRHGRTGHLFQGRYKAILVDGESYLLELTRYVVLNPVRAGMVASPADWLWSSYRAMTGEAAAPSWLAPDGLLAQFSTHRDTAVKRYREFVLQGLDQESIWRDLKRQIFLGEDAFVSQMQAKITGKSEDVNFAKAQRRAPALPLAEYQKRYASRDEAIVSAYASGEYSYQQLADFFGLHFTTVGRTIRAARSNAKL